MALEKLQLKYVPKENSFYREHHHHGLLVLMIMLVLMIIFITVVLFQMFHRPLPSFSAQTPTNQRMELTAYTEPNLLPDTILRWSSKAATLAYTFDFVNYKQQLLAARPYFTEAGWQDYLRSIESLINTVIKNQLFINGVVSGPPVISNQGPLANLGYTWRVQLPFLVTYQSANTPVKRKFFVIITIVRVPTSVNPQGIGIDRFVMV